MIEPRPDSSGSVHVPAYIEAGLRLHARGCSKAEIGRRLGFDEHTVREWCKRYPEALRAYVLDEVGSISQQLAPHLPDAIETLSVLMADDRQMVQATRLRAAHTVLSYVIGKPLPMPSVKRTARKVINVVRASGVTETTTLQISESGATEQS